MKKKNNYIQFNDVDEIYDSYISTKEIIFFMFSCIILLSLLFVELTSVSAIFICFCSVLLSSYQVIKKFFTGVFNKFLSYECICLFFLLLLAFFDNKPLNAALVGILFQFIRILQFFLTKYILNNSYSVFDLIPSYARIIKNEDIVKIKPSHIKEDDIIIVDKNEIVPIDGTVIDGVSSLDLNLLCGDDEKKLVKSGSKVFSGSVNLSERIVVKALCDYNQSYIQTIYDSFDKSLNNKCTIDKVIGNVFKYFQIFTLFLTVILCIIVPIFTHEWKSNLNLSFNLVLISIPFGILKANEISLFKGINFCYDNGAIIKNCKVFDDLFHCDTFICNKTGTLTENEYRVVDVCSKEISEFEFLSIVCKIEANQNHPIKDAIYEYCSYENSDDDKNLNVEFIEGKGLKAVIGENEILFGNAALLANNNITCYLPSSNEPTVHLAVNSTYCGYIILENKTRKNIYDSFESLRANGIKSFVILSCDLRSIVRPIALALNFNNIKAELTSKEKIKAVKYLDENLNNHSTSIYVGNKLDELPYSSNCNISVGTSLMYTGNSIDKFDIGFLGEGISKLSKVFVAAKFSILSLKFNIYLCLVTRLFLLLLVFKSSNIIFILLILLFNTVICFFNSTIYLERKIK